MLAVQRQQCFYKDGRLFRTAQPHSDFVTTTTLLLGGTGGLVHLAFHVGVFFAHTGLTFYI